MSFFKCHNLMLQSSVWTVENSETRIVWITMLMLADRNGEVMASVPGLASTAKVSIEACVEALERFQQPDKWSRSKALDGRRIVPIDGGWEIVNYKFYRELLSESQKAEASAERSRRYRARKKLGQSVEENQEPPF